MGRKRRRKKSRGQQPPSRRQVFRAEWSYEGYPAVVFEVDCWGRPVVTTYVGKNQVEPVSRELAAHWLGEFLPRLSHDERYSLIWERRSE